MCSSVYTRIAEGSWKMFSNSKEGSVHDPPKNKQHITVFATLRVCYATTPTDAQGTAHQQSSPATCTGIYY